MQRQPLLVVVVVAGKGATYEDISNGCVGGAKGEEKYTVSNAGITIVMVMLKVEDLVNSYSCMCVSVGVRVCT